MKTTLNKIREYEPCTSGWIKLLKHLGKTESDDEPLSLVTILDSNGFDHTLWCTRAVKGYDKEIRLFGVWCARQVQHLMSDPRSLIALDVAEQYANGIATEGELRAAAYAARAASRASHASHASYASHASHAAYDAAARLSARDVASAAADAAHAAARAAAYAAAYDATEDSASAAAHAARAATLVASDASYDFAHAAYSAAYTKAKQAQKAKFRKMLEELE